MASIKASAMMVLQLLPAAYAATDPADFGASLLEGVGGAMTCGDMKEIYKQKDCCGSPAKSVDMITVPKPPTMLAGTNVCEGKKVSLDNTDCVVDEVVVVLEQAGANITKGYVGGLDTGDRAPITTSYLEAGLCPVNVHWHLGAEHLSVGQMDTNGKGPGVAIGEMSDTKSRRLADMVRQGLRCHHYDSSDPKFTTPYDWQHCIGMTVGETYEVHWPHSASGACGTPNQYQTPFYDGVFCMGLEKLGIGLSNASLPDMVQGNDGSPVLSSKVAVQGQVFTIVNDESYYYPDLMRGWIVEGEYGMDIAKYTGSTTGGSRNNQICSSYSPITWQVDRKCHLISASSFDKMCADMMLQRDDMSGDLYAHGARETVATNIAGNNLERL
eukprot:TRINITY_DN1318_c0_g1_i2.p1 TRINITY_DN1318_c0_g1~~TRINITY_DN1318_c0_g1_i2.p1  ORF type:complete len:384 (-),score=84.54 TRINITY_DN1318_c0_g1_i2:288-1439(-)